MLCLGALPGRGRLPRRQEETTDEVDPAVPAPWAAPLDLSVGAGEVAYEETVTIDPIDSDWTSDYLRLAAAWSLPDPDGCCSGVQGSYWTASEDTRDLEFGRDDAAGEPAESVRPRAARRIRLRPGPEAKGSI